MDVLSKAAHLAEYREEQAQADRQDATQLLLAAAHSKMANGYGLEVGTHAATVASVER